VINIEVANQQTAWPVTPTRLKQAVSAVLQGEGIAAAEISVAVVDDPTIHQLNRRYLDHDFATDVLSFALQARADGLEGEIVISADTAARQAVQYGWELAEELLLYAIHGALHLVGYDDEATGDREIMRRKEQQYLRRLACSQDSGWRNSIPRGEVPLDETWACKRAGGNQP
jgi:probable rRNA maturation factor